VKRIKEVGVPIDKVMRHADQTGSGVVTRDAFDQALKKVANEGMLRDQVCPLVFRIRSQMRAC